MKKLNKFFLAIIVLFSIQKVMAQTINWHTLDNTKHIANANFGLDYSVSYGIGYGYKLNTKLPIILNADFSMPSGKTVFDDFKIRIGGQILLLNQSNFKGAITLNGIYRRHETSQLRLQNFGSETKGTFGYYKSKWFAAAEIGFDKAIITHFKHTDKYREEVYSDVQDGWYEPATGGNFRYGLQAGFSFYRNDIYLKAGRVLTQDFKTTPLLPFYAELGFSRKF